MNSLVTTNERIEYSQNIEPVKALSSLPYHFQNEAEELVKLLEAYYRFLNKKYIDPQNIGGPSFEINNILRNHDIDMTTDDRYLDAIENIIGSQIPESRAVDRVRLYKIIANYYTNRGSEESIYSFFRLFFNEIVSISYPKELLFDTSGDRSKSSDIFKIRDSFKWQEYSYIIESGIDSTEWKFEYLKYIHPAGLKFFSSVVLILFRNNNWTNPFSNYVFPNYIGSEEEIKIDDAWENIDWDRFFGTHSPLFQSAASLKVDHNSVSINNNQHHYKTNINFIANVESDALNSILFFVSFIRTNSNTRHSMFRNSWRVFEKYVDRGLVGEYISCTIDHAENGSSNFGSGPQFNTLNSHNVKNRFTKSYIVRPPNRDENVWSTTLDNSESEVMVRKTGDVYDYTIYNSSSWNNSFIMKNIPENSYLDHLGLDGYYREPETNDKIVDYYTQPII
jgi:hypothetical protein